jgi:hypothetical protein
MLKSSSLCLYSSNLGTFWLKIEQIWPFEEISIFSNDGHLGYRTVLTDTILKGNHIRIIQTKYGWNWQSGLWQKCSNFKLSMNIINYDENSVYIALFLIVHVELITVELKILHQFYGTCLVNYSYCFTFQFSTCNLK